MNKSIENIIEYGKKLADMDFAVGDHPRILLQSGMHVYATTEGAPMDALNADHVTDIGPSADSFKSAMLGAGFQAMIISQPEYAGMCIEDSLAIPAVLDDMAMIVGTKVQIVPEDRFSMMKALKKASAVMTENGNLITCGRNLYEALTCLLVLEKNAEIFVDADFLGGAYPVNPILGRIEHAVYEYKYSKKEIEKQNAKEAGEAPAVAAADSDNTEPAATPQWTPEEAKLRDAVVEYGKKLVACGLVQGTWGNLSVRLDDEYMLCTPSGRDYAGILPEEIVKVNIATLEYAGQVKPTSEKDFHAGIYRNRSDVNAIIHTHSKFACVFAACGLTFKTTSGDVIECAAYGPSGTGILSKNVQEAIGQNKGCLMKNHGMVAVGSDLRDALRNAQSIEDAAKKRIDEFWK